MVDFMKIRRKIRRIMNLMNDEKYYVYLSNQRKRIATTYNPVKVKKVQCKYLFSNNLFQCQSIQAKEYIKSEFLQNYQDFKEKTDNKLFS